MPAVLENFMALAVYRPRLRGGEVKMPQSKGRYKFEGR